MLFRHPFVDSSLPRLCRSPELAVARADVLTYFHSLKIAESEEIFMWEEPKREFAEKNPTYKLCSALSQGVYDMGFMAIVDPIGTFSKHFPEFEYYRDVMFLWKFFSLHELDGFPTVDPEIQFVFRLNWSLPAKDTYQVCCLSRRL